MIEVPIGKLLPKILGRFGKEKPSKRYHEVAFVQCKFCVTLSVLVQFLYAPYKSLAETSVCMPGSHECCTHTRTMCPSFYDSLVRSQVFRDPPRPRI